MSLDEIGHMLFPSSQSIPFISVLEMPSDLKIFFLVY